MGGSVVGVRELRQNLSVYLRRVQAGEALEVTDRGRPVALLTPIPDASPFQQLLAAGEVDEAKANIDDLGEPIALAPGQEQPSVTLQRLRADER